MSLTQARTARWLPLAAAAVLLASVAAAIFLGVADLSAAEVWRVITSHLGGAALTDDWRTRDAIVWHIRIPRALTAALVGAGLAAAGVVMQGLTRNPLADPYLLGLSSGASLGAVAVLLLGVGGSIALGFALPLAAFAGALVALVAAFTIARMAGAVTVTTVVLAGLAVSQFFSAATSLVVFTTAQGDAYREVLSWLLGSLAGSSWTTVLIGAVALAAIYPALRLSATRLDALALGDTAAESLGVPTRGTRAGLFVLVSLLTGAMVSTSGAIGFVGLILPHLARGLVGGLHRHVLPAAALGGATFLVWADTLARTMLDPREIPVGIVTALVGVPVFVVVLRRARRSAWT